MATDLNNLSIAELKKIKKDNKQKLQEEYKQKLINDIKKIQEKREKIKSESMGAPGRCATCHLSDFSETWPG